MQITTPSLDLGDAVKLAFNRAFEFKGRSRRSEYWWTMLLVYAIDVFVLPLGWIAHLATIPLTVRRLHDTGRSGWWLLLHFIASAVLGTIFVIDYLATLIVTIYNVNESGDNGVILSSLLLFVGRYLVIFILLFIYRVILLIFLCQDSSEKTNKYGPSPKYVSESEIHNSAVPHPEEILNENSQPE